MVDLTRKYDVPVIGGGNAALSAAISARRHAEPGAHQFVLPGRRQGDLNALDLTAERLGVEILDDAEVLDLQIDAGIRRLYKSTTT